MIPRNQWFLLAFMMLAAIARPSAAVADDAVGGACVSPAADAPLSASGNNLVCISNVWQYPAYQLGATAAACNATNAGMLQWTGAAFQYCNGTTWTSVSGGGSSTLNGILAATGNQAGIANGAYTIKWNWDTLAGGSALKLASTSTAAASNAQKMLEIALSGTNGTAGQTTYGEYIANTHAGATSTNVGLYATASGGTTANYAAIFAAGNVGIGTTAPDFPLTVIGDNSNGDTAKIEGTGNSSDIAFFNSSDVWNGAVGLNNSTGALNVASGSGDLIFSTNNTSSAWGTESMRIAQSTGYVGIGGNTTPGALLDIGKATSTLGTLRLEGNTSGYTQIQPAAAAGSWTVTLPVSAGTSGYVLSTNGSGVTSWISNAGTASTALSGLTAAAATHTLANANYAQTWNWDTLTTGTALTLGSTSLTTGSILVVTNNHSSGASDTVTVNSATTANGASAISAFTTGGTGSVIAVQGSTASTSGTGVYGTAIAGTGATMGVEGDTASASANAAGVYGHASAATGATFGVYGQSDSATNGAVGVYGAATATTGAVIGVEGDTASANNNAAGVVGWANDSGSSWTVGVWGEANGTTASGVYGYNASASGATMGVEGGANSASGYAGYFSNDNASGYALATNSGKVKLGSAGTAFTSMGVCTVASYTPTTTATNVTCTGVPASSSVAVSCSPSAAFTTPNTTVINVRATGTASQLAVNLSVANSVAVTLTCMWVKP